MESRTSPGCYFHFRGAFCFVSHSSFAFPGSRLFPAVINAFFKSKLLRLLMLLLHKPNVLQRNLGCWSWCGEPLEYYSISVLRNHSVNVVSWHCGVGDDCKWLRLPELQYLILRSGSSYPIYCILTVFPASFVMYFLRNRKIIMRFLLLRVVFERIQRCQKDCLSSFVDLFSSRNYSTRQNGLRVPRNSSVKDVLLPIVRNKCPFHNSWSYWNTTRVSLNSS